MKINKQKFFKKLKVLPLLIIFFAVSFFAGYEIIDTNMLELFQAAVVGYLAGLQ
jgi:hypothetical protein